MEVSVRYCYHYCKLLHRNHHYITSGDTVHHSVSQWQVASLSNCKWPTTSPGSRAFSRFYKIFFVFLKHSHKYSTFFSSTFMFPCIASITVNDDQHVATILAYLFITNQLYMFRATSSPIIRSTWLYLQLLILSTDTAAGWCHGWDGNFSNIGGQYQKL